MLILEDLSAEIPGTNAFHWNLKKFSTNSNNVALFYGYNSAINKNFLNLTSGYKKILFNNWAPCEFAQEFSHNNLKPLEYDNNMDIIYSIDPYSNEWLNKINDYKTYKNIFYPFCKTLLPQLKEKKYDIIYHGGIHGKEHIDMLDIISEFNYRYCSMTNGINSTTRNALLKATDINLSFAQKIDLVTSTKISICYNVVHVMPEQVDRISSLRKKFAVQNKSFETIGKWNVMPQFKTRMHEAAFSKTLNLVRKDLWNVAELYYEPNKEFLYFDNEKDLSYKIKEILDAWDSKDIQNIIENAYKKSMSYTTEKFIDKISMEEE